jgi:hypothetical protein
MIALMCNLSVALRRFLRTYMPSNVAIDLLRTRRGLKWALPVALIMVPAYLFASAMASAGVGDSGLGWLNVLVLMFCWNAMKFAWLGVLFLPRLAAAVTRRLRFAKEPGEAGSVGSLS